MSWGNVTIATRIGKTPEPWFFNAWTGLVRHGLHREDQVMPAVIYRPAHWAANLVIDKFLTDPRFGKCDTLCFIDDDHSFGIDTLERLRQDGDGYGVMGALYMARTQGRPLIMRYAEDNGPTLEPPGPFYNFVAVDPLGAVVEVDLLGFGFTMVRREVLEALPKKPVFYIGTECTEDAAFCVQCQRAGYKLAVHTGVEVDHIIPGLTRVSERSAENGGQEASSDSG